MISLYDKKSTPTPKSFAVPDMKRRRLLVASIGAILALPIRHTLAQSGGKLDIESIIRDSKEILPRSNAIGRQVNRFVTYAQILTEANVEQTEPQGLLDTLREIGGRTRWVIGEVDSAQRYVEIAAEQFAQREEEIAGEMSKAGIIWGDNSASRAFATAYFVTFAAFHADGHTIGSPARRPGSEAGQVTPSDIELWSWWCFFPICFWKG